MPLSRICLLNLPISFSYINSYGGFRIHILFRAVTKRVLSLGKPNPEAFCYSLVNGKEHCFIFLLHLLLEIIESTCYIVKKMIKY